jgi:hypothetical protein
MTSASSLNHRHHNAVYLRVGLKVAIVWLNRCCVHTHLLSQVSFASDSVYVVCCGLSEAVKAQTWLCVGFALLLCDGSGLQPYDS